MDIFTLKILGFDVPVIQQPDLVREHSKAGHYDAYKKQIKISSDLTEPAKLRTLIHEIIEVIDCELVLGLKHEEHISKLDTALFQVFSDNKDIFKKLLG